MAEFTDTLTDKHIEMIGKQPVFFVATAAAGARVSISPKGYDAFRVLSPSQVGYLDLGGSGNETQAHLAADGRITIMFCNFQQPALILRIYGTGKAILPQDGEWADVAAHFTLMPGTRQIFLIDINSVQTSCGWGVPLMTLERERETLTKYHAGQDPVERLKTIQDRTSSIDGLPVRVQTSMPFNEQ